MPDQKPKNESQSQFDWKNLPIPTVVWVIVSILLFIVGLQTVTMEDRERFTDDFCANS